MQATETLKPKKPTKRDLARQEARESILRHVKPGDTVYCVLRHVSRSGMYRRISFYVMADAGPDYKPEDRYYPCYLDYWIIQAGIGDKPRGDRAEGIGVGGCGMDMGFHVVYNLGLFLWPRGTDKPHGTRNGEPDSSGGYALKHRWI